MWRAVTRVRWASCCVALLIASGCRREGPPPRIEAVAPPEVSVWVDSSVTITGRDFHGNANASLDGGNAELDLEYRVFVGEVELPSADVAFVDTKTLEVIIRAGTAALGVHDVTIVAPDGRRSVLASALTISDAPIGLALSIEDAAGGTGQPVGDLSLTADESRTLHAIARDASGAYVTDTTVSWTVAGGVGAVSSASASSVVFDANATGTGSVRIDHAAAATPGQTGTITVLPGRVASFTIAPATLAVNADDPPTGFTVENAADADGNPTTDLGTIVWSVASGPITQIDAATGGFDPVAAGTGTVQAASSHGPSAQSGTITVAPGRAVSITAAPATLSINADDPPYAFTASGLDADGNATTDLGTITWSVASGPIGNIAPASGVFDPVTAGSGTLRVDSSHGPFDETGTVTVVPGKAASLAVSPDTATMSADDLPLPFSVSGMDGDGNATTDLGTITWSVSSGVITAIDPSSGMFSPAGAGTGTIRATSSYGAFDDTGTITVDPGEAVVLAVAPDTLTTNADDAATSFTVAGTDFDGNPTSNLGTITWSVSSGAISAIDPATGAFDPTAAGNGTVRATSSHGAFDDSGAVVVVPGRAAVLAVSPDTATLTADDPAIAFTVAGTDGDGNATTDLGTITWSVASGPITALDASTGVFDPVTAGSGTVRATSDYGPSDDSGMITVDPGALATLTVSPDTLIINADDAPAAFTVAGVDGDGNAVSDLGTITWSIASGPITRIDASTGVFDPMVAGTGAVRATSSHGPSDDSGAVTVTPGRAVSIAVVPDTLTIRIADPSVTFTVDATDADGNATTDVGTLTWSSVGVSGIEPSTGVFTAADPPGSGTVHVDSAYGLADDSGTVTVTEALSISALTTPAAIQADQQNVRLDVTVQNEQSEEAQLTGARISIDAGGTDVTGQYAIRADWRNPSSVPANGSATLVFWVDVGASPTNGAITITATVETLFASTATFVTRMLGGGSSVGGLLLPAVSISAPTADDARRVCASGSIGYASGVILESPSWYLPGGDPSTSTAASPTVAYAAIGSYPFAVTATDLLGAQNTAKDGGMPIFVGTVGDYPTGPVILAAPLAGASIDLATLPIADAIRQAAANAMKNCDGTNITDGAAGKYLTLFVDRGRLDATQDALPGVPGLQRILGSTGQLPDTALDVAPGSALEGPATLYVEHLKMPEGVVTAARAVDFTMTNDTVAPAVSATWPLADCTTACAAKSDAIRIAFSEPMDDPTSTTQYAVAWKDGVAGCADAGFTDVTGTSTMVYDSASWSMTALAPAQASSLYTVRLALATMRDASSNANALPPFSRCMVVDGRTTAAPAAPLLTVGPDPFSPDHDGVDETTTFTFDVDAESAVLKVEIRKNFAVVRRLVLPVSGAGTYAVPWDGRDADGRVVLNGFYAWSATVENAGGASSPAVQGGIEVRTAVNHVGPKLRLD